MSGDLHAAGTHAEVNYDTRSHCSGGSQGSRRTRHAFRAGYPGYPSGHEGVGEEALRESCLIRIACERPLVNQAVTRTDSDPGDPRSAFSLRITNQTGRIAHRASIRVYLCSSRRIRRADNDRTSCGMQAYHGRAAGSRTSSVWDCIFSGRMIQNAAPSPWAELTPTSPPSRCVSSLEIDRPSPVPPNSRVCDAST